MSNNLMFELLNGDVDLGKFCDWIAGKETQVIWTYVLLLRFRAYEYKITP